MKTKLFITAILVTLIFSACVSIGPANLTPTQPLLPTTPTKFEPTDVSPIDGTATPGEVIGPEVIQLGGLTMEVYELLANASSDDGSFKTTSGSSNEILKTHRPLRDVFDQPFSPPPVNGRQLTASENFVDEKMIVVAKLDNEEVLTIDCGDPSPINNLRGTWVIVDDWFVEVAHTDNEADGNNVYSYGTGEIFMNGVSLNEQFGYDETFGFQPLNEKPFYFFSKDGEIGISYDGEVSTLDFDSVQHYACCSAGAFNPKAYLTMVTFFASKADKNYYVEMGLFSAFDLDILDISGAGLTVEAFELQDGSWPDEEHHQSRPAGSLPGWVLKRHEDERKNGIPYQETSQFQGKLLSAKVNAENPKEAAVEVRLDDEVVLNMQIGDFTRFAAMSLLYKVFADTEHWYLEMAIQCKTSDGIVSCEPTGEIFRNGVSLNQLNGYDETFGFQLLAGEPFFFFKKGDEYGLNYAGEEVMLGFDEIAYNYCCGFGIYNPTHYDNMVSFFASKDGVRYYVELGLFSAPDLEVLDLSGAGLTVEAFELQDGSWPDNEHYHGRPTSSLPGWVFKRHKAERKDIIPYQIDSQLFEGKVLSAGTVIENTIATVEVRLDDELILRVPAGDLSYAAAMDPLQGLRTHQEHWYMEMEHINGSIEGNIIWVTANGEIFRSGESLSELFGYDETFGFQVMAGEPFFFFRKGDEYGLNYADEEVMLGFDEIAHYYCCGFSVYNPSRYENMVAFFASKVGVRYYVEAGVFE